MQRYFSNNKKNNIFTLSADDSFHIKTVMRMKKGDRIEIVNENIQYICIITSLEENVQCEIERSIFKEETKIPKVIIAQSLVKEQKMDYILQKGTELGAFMFIPIATQRSIIKIDEKKDTKYIRWGKILKEASEQCKRINVPILEKTCNLKEIITGDYDYKFICSVNEKSKTIKSVLSKVDISDTILFVIGPEGGFSESEEKLLIESGFESVTLGENVLRTETASLFVLSAVNYEFMR